MSQEDLQTLQVTFKPIPEDVVEQLIAQGDIFMCAGGLMIEDPLVAPLITSQFGTDDAVKGLCKETLLSTLLKAAGLQFAEDSAEMWDSEDS